MAPLCLLSPPNQFTNLDRCGGLRSDVPFGPSMLAGALVAVVWGELLAREYLLPGLY